MSSYPLDDLLALAAVPAPTFAEEPRIAWLEEHLAGAPGRRERDAVGNLIWSWGHAPPRLLLLAHVDTVFAANVPLEFRRDGTRLVGPGIGDNAAAVVAVADAVRALLEHGRPAAGAVAFTVGEEGLGDLRGAHAACDALRPRAVVAVEGEGLEEVLVDAVGSVRARLRVEGPGGHSWVDRGGASAVHALLRLGVGLLDLATGETPVNVGVVAGGQGVNSIAAAAELLVEMRALEEAPLDAFANALEELTVDRPLTLAVERVGRRPAGRLDRSHPLLAAVMDARAELGLPRALGAGSTDANAALARGIPALTIGVARGGRMHTEEEWIDVESLDLGLRQLEALLARYLISDPP